MGGVEFDAFGGEEAALSVGGWGVATGADSAGGVDDAVPGDVPFFGRVAEDGADESGAAGEASHAGDIAVGGDVAGRDPLDGGEDASGLVVHGGERKQEKGFTTKSR